MAKISFKGLEEYSAKISRLGKRAIPISKMAVYDGAGLLADEMKEALKSLPIQEGKNGLPPYAKPGEKLKGISKKQRQDLIDSMGLTKIEERDGWIQTKLGWDGYGSITTKKHPKGVPNQLLMRSIESGTSFREKNPIVRKTVNKVNKKVIDKMAQRVDKEIKKEMK